jgi:predicted GNAT family N-acyltransferase
MDDGLTLRRLEEREWPEAMTLAARSFHGEPFAAVLFGDEPVQRFARTHRFYQAAPWSDSDQQLGAFVDGVLVGLCLSSPAGDCHICEHLDLEQPPPADPGARLDREFELNTRVAHSDQGRHAWLGRLVVDPVLQGAGLGRALMAATLEGLRETDNSVGVLLECQAHREKLYLGSGFVTVRTFPDPGGPDCLLMRAEVAPRH